MDGNKLATYILRAIRGVGLIWDGFSSGDSTLMRLALAQTREVLDLIEKEVGK